MSKIKQTNKNIKQDGSSSNKFNKEDENKIIARYLDGESARKISRDLNCHHCVINRILDFNKIPRRNNTQQNHKYSCDSNYFSIIDEEHKAYWLGFIYADGNLHITQHYNGMLRIQIATRDEEILHKFKKDLNATYPIYQTKNTIKGRDTIYYKSSIHIRDKKIYEDLINLGVNHNKTLNCLPPTPEQVPYYLQRHFIRGFLDGDGWISDNKYEEQIGFCGTYEMMFFIREFFGHNNKIRESKNIFDIRWKGKKSAKLKLDILYKDATIYLERKYKKYKNI